MPLIRSCPTFRAFSSLPRNHSIASSFLPSNISTIYKPAARSFHASPAAMTIRTYFDVTWEGPVLDQKMNPTSNVQGKKPLHSVTVTTFAQTHPSHHPSIHCGLSTWLIPFSRTIWSYQFQSVRRRRSQDGREFPCALHQREGLWLRWI